MNDAKIFLIIDDDTDDYDFFCEAVADIDSSVKCISAINGEDGLMKLHNNIKQLPDFIFLDLNMPCMDGRTFLSEVKKDELLKNIPVIIFTTSSSSKDIEDTRKLGAHFFITKPAEFQKLRSEIVFVMEKLSLNKKELSIH